MQRSTNVNVKIDAMLKHPVQSLYVLLSQCSMKTALQSKCSHELSLVINKYDSYKQDGRTALYIASWKGHALVVKLLLQTEHTAVNIRKV